MCSACQPPRKKGTLHSRVKHGTGAKMPAGGRVIHAQLDGKIGPENDRDRAHALPFLVGRPGKYAQHRHDGQKDACRSIDSSHHRGSGRRAERHAVEQRVAENERQGNLHAVQNEYGANRFRFAGGGERHEKRERTGQVDEVRGIDGETAGGRGMADHRFNNMSQGPQQHSCAGPEPDRALPRRQPARAMDTSQSGQYRHRRGEEP